jgi:hypothetical protein
MLCQVQAVDQVFAAIQSVKTGAPAYCTNFYPVESKLESWIAHREMWFDADHATTFFLRKDRDFWRVYFCAPDQRSVAPDLAGLPVVQTERVVLDILGNEPALEAWLPGMKSAGLRPYSRLQRMARSPRASLSSSAAGESIGKAAAEDTSAVMGLLQNSFDHYADQLPPDYEVSSAIKAGQILKLNCDGVLAALLFFETTGLSSTLRYWAVGERFQSRGFGAALIRHYFSIHNTVRRFLLWVVLANQNALAKYQHYGYVGDGLFDLVLVNERIHP